MYNEEQKQRFITDAQFTEDRRLFAESLFASLEKYENAWGADVCTRSEEELQPVINELSGIRTSALHTRLSLLKLYVTWCRNNGVPGVTDAVFHVSPDHSEKIRSQMISGPLALQKFLDALFRPVSDHDISVVFRCFYWLVFAGVKERDVLSVKKGDVDLNSMLIRFNGEEYPIYKEAVEAFRLATELETFYYYHSLYKNRIEMPRADSEFLMVGREGVFSMRYVNSYVLRHRRAAEKDVKVKLSFDHTYLSGIFYRKFEEERASGSPLTYEDFLDAVDILTKGTKYSEKSFGTPKKMKQMKIRLAKMYLEDYITWKKVFSV